MRTAEMIRVAAALALLAACASSSEPTAREREGARPSQASRAALAMAYRAGDRGVDRIIRQAQSAVASSPDDARPYAELTRALLRKQRETGEGSLTAYAADALAAAEEIAPRDRELASLRILLFREQHRFADARDAARELIARDPRSVDGHLLLGDAELELGAYERAVEAYQTALDLRPDLRTYDRAGYARWLYGDVEGALEMMEAALQSASAGDAEPAAWVWIDLGAMLLSRGQADAALRAADRAESLVASYLPAQILRGRALARQGRTEDAIARFQAAAERQGTVDSYLALAELLDRAGRTADADRALGAAERWARREPLPMGLYLARHAIDPERSLELARIAHAERPSVFAESALALALLRAGRIDEARAASERAMRLGTRDATFHLHRALIERAAGNLAAASECVARARAIDPGADPLLSAELARGGVQ